MSDAVLEEVLEEISADQPCRGGCGRNVVSRWTWSQTPELERLEMREDGYVRDQADHICQQCWVAENRPEPPPPEAPRVPRAKVWPRQDMLARHAELVESGLSSARAREQMGITRARLNNAKRRARLAGEEIP